MDFYLILKISVTPAVLLAIAFFEGAETVLTSLSKAGLDQLKQKHSHRRVFLEYWEAYPGHILTSLVLGNTLAVIFCGVLAVSIGEVLALYLDLPAKLVITGVTFVLSLLVFVFCEVLPKILGRQHAERLAPIVIVPLVPFARIIYPLNQIFVKIAGLFIRFIGVESQKEIPSISASELNEMVDERSTSHRLLKNILELGRLTARDISKPREKIFAVDIRWSPREVIKVVTEAPFSRIPVYRDSLDNIVGIIYSKDLLAAWRTEGLILIPDLIRPAYFTSETTPVSELLREFKKGHYHLAIVRDAVSQVSGIVTIEDIIKEIVGEVYDEAKLVGIG